MENVIRKDLNEMVSGISLKLIKTRYSERAVCQVKLFNDEIVEFKDSDGLFDLLKSYKKCGIDFKDVIESKALIEEFRSDSVDSVDAVVDEGKGTYVCVLYKLKDGSKYRLFVSRFVDLKIIDNYYNVWKSKQKEKGKGGIQN